MPTYLHSGTKNPPNSTPTSIPRHIKKMIAFGIDVFGHLGSIWGAKLGPDWHHFRLKWGGAVGCYRFLCFVASFILRFRGFDPVFAPTWLVVGHIFAFLGAKLAPFWGNWTQERSWMKSNIPAWPGGMREAIE